jgi:hypothetical protein
MGRYLKNTQLEGGSYAIQLPIGSNSVGPDVPVDGQFRYNSSNSRIEFFIAGSWKQVFTMSQTEVDANAILVQIGGVYQQPNVNYTVNGTTSITFTGPPPAPGINPNKIVVVHNLNSTDAA